jgi:adenylate cyclase
VNARFSTRFHLFRRIAQASWFSVSLIGAVIIFGMAALYIAQPSPIVRLDWKIYDAFLPLRAAPEPSPVPVIIDLDEASLAAYGQWPWSRYLVADLLFALNDYQVAAIGLDILFSEADRTSPERMRESLQQDKGARLSLDGLPRDLYDFDRLMAEALAQTPSVLAAYAHSDGTIDAALLPPSTSFIERASPDAMLMEDTLQPRQNAVLPLSILRDKAPVGFINISPDADGILRKIPLLIRVRDNIYPSLSLRALMLGMETQTLRVSSGVQGLESIQIGEQTLPVTPQGEMYIPFIGPNGTYPYISAKDVLRKSVPPEALAGRVVFVGTSVRGLLDIRATPLDPLYPGVEIHAAALDTLLTGNAISVPPWTPALQILGILLSGIIAAFAFGFARPRIYLPVAAALIAAAVMLSRHLFADGLFVSPLYIVVTVALIGASQVFLRFWHEERQKLILRNAFSRYVSPEIVKRITRLSGNLFAGEERKLSILFTDIRGFTSISEKLSPDQVVKLLNCYFTPMTALVREHSGTMDKFIGDALMAFWNAPLEVPGHAGHATETALAMQEILLTLNEELLANFGVNIRMGAGVHTGAAYVGNMGSAELVNYTLIGDNVNLASRLEGLCPQYGVGVIVSGETRDGCADMFAFQYLDTIRVKGKSQPVSIYTPMRHALALTRHEELLAWETASEHYRSGNFAKAAPLLADLCERFPETMLYRIYAERAQILLATPPADWDGVWIATEK